nr:MAG TPA: hypothetical protein [Caudoviricetes sp.]
MFIRVHSRSSLFTNPYQKQQLRLFFSRSVSSYVHCC